MLYADSVSTHTRFISVRSGNVIGTSESVVLLFKDQIRQNNWIGITDKAMTRYFVTGDVTSELMLDALTDGLGGEIFLPDMPACKITDLAEVIVEKYGKRDTELRVVGIRPGEKLHEHLISDHEVKYTVLYEKTANGISWSSPPRTTRSCPGIMPHTPGLRRSPILRTLPA